MRQEMGHIVFSEDVILLVPALFCSVVLSLLHKKKRVSLCTLKSELALGLLWMTEYSWIDVVPILRGEWPQHWCFWILVLEKTLESPLDYKIKPVNPKGNQPRLFIARSDVEAKTPILWPPDVKSQLIGEDADAGKDWRQKEKREAEDEMVR